MRTYIVTGYDLGKAPRQFVVTATNVFQARGKALALVDFISSVEVLELK